MKRLDGTILYINLGLAILWDILGLLLLVIQLVPVVQVFGIILSIVLDFLALFTSIVLGTIYYTYLGVAYLQFRVYQITEVKKLISLQKSSNTQASQSAPFAREAQEFGKEMIRKLKKYLEEVQVQRIIQSMIAWIFELIPLVGDISPTWTIKAWIQLQNHQKRASRLKDDVEKFEAKLNKWRSVIRNPVKSLVQGKQENPPASQPQPS